eukprot:gene7910-5685_t
MARKATTHEDDRLGQVVWPAQLGEIVEPVVRNGVCDALHIPSGFSRSHNRRVARSASRRESPASRASGWRPPSHQRTAAFNAHESDRQLELRLPPVRVSDNRRRSGRWRRSRSAPQLVVGEVCEDAAHEDGHIRHTQHLLAPEVGRELLLTGENRREGHNGRALAEEVGLGAELVAQTPVAVPHGEQRTAEAAQAKDVPISPVGDDKDEEVGIEEDRGTLAPRGSFVTADGDVLIPNGGNISFFDYLRLAETYDVKIRRLCGKLSNPERDEDDEFLESTHLILYKWHDYFSLPKRFNANFLYGEQATLADGTFDPNDNNRTLLGFRNPDCLFVVILAYIVLIAELGVLIGVVYDLLYDCSSSESKQITSLAVQLCTLYAATVASNAFFRFLPFEITGQKPAGYCALVEAANFVSVEIVVHIHEFIPRAMRIVDRSPGAFNASFVDWYKELERVNLLSEVYPQTTRRIRRAPDSVYRRVFLFFCLYTLLAFYGGRPVLWSPWQPRGHIAGQPSP